MPKRTVPIEFAEGVPEEGITSKVGFLIYGLLDPETRAVRYVGKSCTGLKRPREHLAPLQLRKHKNYKNSWVLSLKARGLNPIIRVLEVASDAEALFDLENRWMGFFRAQGADLTNLVESSRGALGWSHDDEAKKKISEASKRRWKVNPIVYTPEIREACGASMRGKKVDRELIIHRLKVRGIFGCRVIANDGTLVREFDLLREAAEFLGVPYTRLYDRVRGFNSDIGPYEIERLTE
jgi:hypothetical protein